MGFLAAYSAAIHVDVVHAMSLAAMHDDPDTDWRKKRAAVHKPKPQVQEFIKLRANIWNLVSPIGTILFHRDFMIKEQT